MKMSIAKKINPLIRMEQIVLTQFHIQTVIDESCDFLCPFVHLLLIIAQQNKIVAIADISFHMQNMFYIHIHLVHENVAEPLRKEVPNRNIPFRVRAVDYIIEQGQHFLVFDFASNNLF